MDDNISRVTVGMFATNCWLYAYDDEEQQPSEQSPAAGRPCVIIDPGDDAGKIISRLKKLGWVPRHILLTHGHFDHLFALPDLLASLKNGALGRPSPLPKIGIHRLDSHFLGRDALKAHRDSFMAIGIQPGDIGAIMKPLPEADILFEEDGETANQNIGPFKVLQVPGHSKGSIALYDEKAKALFSGDTLFKRGQGRTDLPGGDEREIIKSLKRLLSMDGEIAVYPGHGAATTIGEER